MTATATEQTPVTPQAIRLILRAAGFVTISDRNREGVRVPNISPTARSWSTPTIHVDLDNRRQRNHLIDAICETLAEAGLVAERFGGDDVGLLHVHRQPTTREEQSAAIRRILAEFGIVEPSVDAARLGRAVSRIIHTGDKVER